MSDLANAGYRWTAVTPADRSGILYIVTVLSSIYTSIVFVTRVVIRWHILGLDDGAMLIAQVSSLPSLPSMVRYIQLTKRGVAQHTIRAHGHFVVEWTSKIVRCRHE
jgi:hypothetical protein